MKVRADAPSRAALRDDEEELAGGVRVSREEGIAAEPLAASVGQDVGTWGERQLLVGDSHRRRCGSGRRGELEITRSSRTREGACRHFVRRVRRDLGPVLPFAHRSECGADPMVHRKQSQLSAIGLHRPAMRRPGRQIGKVAAHHDPTLGPAVPRQLELDFAAHHEHRSVAAQVRMPRHGRTGIAGEGGELVNVAGVFPPRDALHDLTADAVILAGVVRQDVHALLAW